MKSGTWLILFVTILFYIEMQSNARNEATIKRIVTELLEQCDFGVKSMLRTLRHFYKMKVAHYV